MWWDPERWFKMKRTLSIMGLVNLDFSHIKSIKDDLRTLAMDLNSPTQRGSGRTHQIAEAVRRANGILVCATPGHSNTIRNKYNIETLVLDDVLFNRKLRVTRKPVFFDHLAYESLLHSVSLSFQSVLDELEDAKVWLKPLKYLE